MDRYRRRQLTWRRAKDELRTDEDVYGPDERQFWRYMARDDERTAPNQAMVSNGELRAAKVRLW